TLWPAAPRRDRFVRAHASRAGRRRTAEDRPHLYVRILRHRQQPPRWRDRHARRRAAGRPARAVSPALVIPQPREETLHAAPEFGRRALELVPTSLCALLGLFRGFLDLVARGLRRLLAFASRLPGAVLDVVRGLLDLAG